MGDEYNNLNAQDLYEQFLEKFKENKKSVPSIPNTSFLIDNNKLLCHFYKVIIAVMFFGIIINQFLTIAILKYFYGLKTGKSVIHILKFSLPEEKSNLGAGIFLFFVTLGCIVIASVYITDKFSDIDKDLTEKTIDEVMKKNNIILTDEALDKLIINSKDVGGKLLRICNQIKRIVSIGIIKALIISFLGFIVTIVDFSIEYSKDIDPFDIIRMLFELYYYILGYLLIFLAIGYGIDKFANRKKELYLEVLEDKKLTLCLRNSETVESVEEEIKKKKNEEDIDKKEDNIGQEKEGK